MKLAFCLYNYFPYGGLQRDFMRVAELSAGRGHEVHVHTMQFAGTAPSSFIIHEHKPSAAAVQNHTRVKQFIKNVQSALKTNKYDVVIGFNKMQGLDLYYAADGCFAAKLAAKPLALLQRLLPRNQTYLALEKAVFDPSQRTKVIYIAQQNQLTYQQYYHLSPEKQHLLPPGIDPLFKTLPEKKTVMMQLRHQLQLKQDMFTILIVASRFKTKGLDRAITAIASLPTSVQKRVQFVVIGQDHAKPFQQLAKRLSVEANIKYMGAQDNIAAWMQAADLLLHPAYHESAGLTLLEAIAANLPILTTANCGYANYVSKANAGIVVDEPFKQSILNDALHTLIATPTSLQAFSESAKSFAKQADFYNMPIAMLEIIEQLGQRHVSSCA